MLKGMRFMVLVALLAVTVLSVTGCPRKAKVESFSPAAVDAR